MRSRLVTLGIAIVLAIVLILSLTGTTNANLREASPINPTHIEEFMQAQVDIGPRHPGSAGSLEFRDWLLDTVPDTWSVEIQEFTILGVEVRNFLITHEDAQEWPQILIGAHYDSRRIADQDDDNPDDPVPAANDGASGVAAILEMMDHLGTLAPVTGFVLFDAEDQGRGGIEGWNYIMGSEYFVDQMTSDEINSTKIFILYDMIANDELVLKYEGFSDKTYRESIWDKGIELGYEDIFTKSTGSYLIDDHRPFLDVGIPAVDIIDFNYPEWHTTQDTMDNVSAENAAIVVDTVLEWLLNDFNQVTLSSTDSSSVTTEFSSSTQPSPIYLTPVLISIYLSSKKNNVHTRYWKR